MNKYESRSSQRSSNFTPEFFKSCFSRLLNYRKSTIKWFCNKMAWVDNLRIFNTPYKRITNFMVNCYVFNSNFDISLYLQCAELKYFLYLNLNPFPKRLPNNFISISLFSRIILKLCLRSLFIASKMRELFQAIACCTAFYSWKILYPIMMRSKDCLKGQRLISDYSGICFYLQIRTAGEDQK